MRIADLRFLEIWNKIKDNEFYLGKFLIVSAQEKGAEFKMIGRKGILIRNTIADAAEGQHCMDLQTAIGILKTYPEDATIKFIEEGVVINGINFYDIYIPVSVPDFTPPPAKDYSTYQVPERVSEVVKFIPNSDGLDSIRISDGYWFLSNREITVVLEEPDNMVSKPLNVPVMAAKYLSQLQDFKVATADDKFVVEDGADTLVFAESKSIVPDITDPSNKPYIFPDKIVGIPWQDMYPVFKRAMVLTQKTIDNCQISFTETSLKVETTTTSKIIEHISCPANTIQGGAVNIRPSLLIQAMSVLDKNSAIEVGLGRGSRTLSLTDGGVRIVLGTS